VNQENAPRFESDNYILPATVDGLDPLAGQLRSDFERVLRARQAWVEDLDPVEAATDEHGLEPAADGLDLWQLGHGAQGSQKGLRQDVEDHRPLRRRLVGDRVRGEQLRDHLVGSRIRGGVNLRERFTLGHTVAALAVEHDPDRVINRVVLCATSGSEVEGGLADRDRAELGDVARTRRGDLQDDG
jgi:hypothetical protein